MDLVVLVTMMVSVCLIVWPRPLGAQWTMLMTIPCPVDCTTLTMNSVAQQYDHVLSSGDGWFGLPWSRRAGLELQMNQCCNFTHIFLANADDGYLIRYSLFNQIDEVTGGDKASHTVGQWRTIRKENGSEQCQFQTPIQLNQFKVCSCFSVPSQSMNPFLLPSRISMLILPSPWSVASTW